MVGFSMLDNDIMGDDYKLSSLFGVQIGSRWYFKPKEKYGFGLMVNWVDFAMGVKSGTIDGTDWARAAIDFSFLEVDPVGPFVLADNLALDAYYNLRPTELVIFCNPVAIQTCTPIDIESPGLFYFSENKKKRTISDPLSRFNQT